MKSAIKTIEKAIHGLNLELRIFGKPPNFSKRIIKECTEELKEHKKALELIKKEKL